MFWFLGSLRFLTTQAERTGADALAGFPFAMLDPTILARCHEWLPSLDHATRLLHVYCELTRLTPPTAPTD